jgi:hypothetical protein
MRNPRHRRVIAGILAAVALSACAPAAPRERIVTVTHAAVTATLVDGGPSGPSAGDVRYFSIETAADGGTGRLEAVLSTTAEDVPEAGAEVRIGDLVFTFGDGTDQVTVLGASVYPAAGSTLAIGASTIRPVVGGSGAYAGVTGWCESFHEADGTWRHVLHLRD